MLGVELGAPLQRLADPLPHAAGRRPRFHRDQVGDALHPGQGSHGLLGGFLLVIPVHLADEPQPALLDLDLDSVVRHRDVPGDGIDRRPRDLRIRPLRALRQPHLDLVGDPFHALHPAGDPLRQQLVPVAGGEPAQGDDPLLNAHRDVLVLEARLPPDLLEDVALDLAVDAHGSLRHGRGEPEVGSARDAAAPIWREGAEPGVKPR